MKRDYKVVFSDIDGTLLNAAHQITEGTKEKIAELFKEGIPFVLVSARSPKAMEGIWKELGGHSPIVAFAGAVIMDANGRMLHSVELEGQKAEEICHYIQKQKEQVVINLFFKDCWMVEDRKVDWIRKEMEITGLTPEKVSFTEKNNFKRIHKILCMGNPEQIDSLEKKLIERFPQVHVSKSKDTYLEIMSPDATKANAIRKMESLFEMKREETVAFGDSQNDMGMLQYAGLGIAMGNAAQEVKEAADEIAATNEEEGLKKMLCKIFEKN